MRLFAQLLAVIATIIWLSVKQTRVVVEKHSMRLIKPVKHVVLACIQMKMVCRFLANRAWLVQLHQQLDWPNAPHAKGVSMRKIRKVPLVSTARPVGLIPMKETMTKEYPPNM